MTTTMVAALGYIAWTLILMMVMEIFRIYITVKTGRAANNFLPDGSDISPFAHRLARAHANCYENFPIIAGALFFAIVSDLQSITDPLALWLLGARMAQSITHLISGSAQVVTIRFLFYITQLSIVAYWIVQFIGRI